MWIFGMGLYLVRIAGDTMQLSAISGLATGLAIFFLGAFVGDWVDSTRRLKGEKVPNMLKKIKITRSIQRTQTPPRLSPLTCDVDLMTRSRMLKLSKIMLRLDTFCNHSFL